MAETSIVKTPTQGAADDISTLDQSILKIITKNPNRVKGCDVYNIDYNSDPAKNRYVSPTFTVSRVTIGLVQAGEDYRKPDSPNYFITIRKTGTAADTGDTEEFFNKVREVESVMDDTDEFSQTNLSSNIKEKNDKDPAIFLKLKYAKKSVKNPDNPKKPKRVTDKTRLSTKFYRAKKIDGKPVLVPVEFDPKDIEKHVFTNSIMQAQVTFDYAWKMNSTGKHGINIHLDKAILLPPKKIVRAADHEMAVPDYMIASDSEDEGEDPPAEDPELEAKPDDLEPEPEPEPEPVKKKSSRSDKKKSRGRRKKE